MILMTIIAAATAVTSAPSEEIASAVVAEGLLKMCHGSETEQALCMGYIGGVTSVDTYLDAIGERPSNMCISETADFEEVIGVVTNYIEMHPETSDAPSAKVVLEALTKAYPCE